LWSICLAKLRQWREQIPLPAPTVLQVIESAVTLAAQKGLFTSKKQGSVTALFANAHGTGDKLPEFAQQVHFRRLIRSGCQADNHSYAWCYADFYDALVAMAESGQGQRKDYSRIKAELERDLPAVEPGVDDVCGIVTEREMQMDAGVRYQPLQHTTQHEYLRSGVFDGTCRHCGKKNAKQCQNWSELLSTTYVRENCVRLEHCIARADTLLRSSRGDNALKQYATYKLLAPATSMLDDVNLEAAVGTTLKQKLQDAVAQLREILDRKAPPVAHGGRAGAANFGRDADSTVPETSGTTKATATEPRGASTHSPRAAAVAIAHQMAPEVASGARQSQEEGRHAAESNRETAQREKATAQREKEAAKCKQETAQRDIEKSQREMEKAQRDKEAAERRSELAQLEKQVAQRDKEAAERRSKIAQREKEEAQKEKKQLQREKEELQREKAAAERRSEIAQRENAEAQRQKEAAEREKEEAQQEKEEAQRENEQAQRDKEEAQRDKEEAQRDKEAAELQKQVAIQEKNAVQAVLAATRQRMQKVVAVARAVAAVAASLLSFVWAIGLVTSLGLAFWTATAVVVAIVAITALVRCVVLCGNCSICAGVDNLLPLVRAQIVYCFGEHLLRWSLRAAMWCLRMLWELLKRCCGVVWCALITTIAALFTALFACCGF